MAKEKRSFYGTGRRKGSVAKVTLTPGTGKITVNGRDVHEYMPYEVLVMDLKQPLVVTNNENTFDVKAEVIGGGFSGQTGAIRLGITRALLVYDEDNAANEDSYRRILKANGFVTRDPRVKERNMVLKVQEELHNLVKDNLEEVTLIVTSFFNSLNYSKNIINVI